jgi:lysophospholipase L1-like esterase
MSVASGRRAFTAAGAVALAAVALASGRPLAQDGFALRDGDRVVFYGDSITEARHYTSFVETYVVTRFPKLDVMFVHSGWGGDGVSGGLGGDVDRRLERDVLAYQPTVLTIMLGMNDGGKRPFDAALFEAYASGYRHILDTVRRSRPGIRITVLQPSPYDDVTRAADFEGGYNAVLLRYGQFVKELAATERMTVADLNGPAVRALTRAKAADPAAAARLIPDRIHPGTQITLVMAQALLEAWNAPATVTEVQIDVPRKAASVQVRTRVSDVRAGNGISWTQEDEALPMPLDVQDPLMALVLRSCDFVEALDRQPLKVLGLPAGGYVLRIDGEPVGSFTSAQLASGINLAELPAPMTRQAAEVHALTLRHNGLHWLQWRAIQVAFAATPSPELTEALRALDALEATLVKRQREAAQPKPRHYELRAETSTAAP